MDEYVLGEMGSFVGRLFPSGGLLRLCGHQGLLENLGTRYLQSANS